ncbi:PREDICTED: mRNAion factor [Prunus dulcis]|uniref:PREDICTED: mRNAion factor n=1 Tax=Prunus dulcis TaxID=3755 RepID=A0A5E4EA17_PRUDU|nr:transcription factor GTE6-like [Prunus dulcis]VVA12282.1 PREDICTED: mRNAion factor [Prunus dulcis]
METDAIDSVFAKLDQMEVDNDIHTESSVNSPNNYAKPESFKYRVDDISIKVEKLRQRVDAIELSSTAESSSAVKHKEKNIQSILKKQQLDIQIIKKKQQQDAWEAAAEKRMQKLMHRFGSIFRQIRKHQYAWVFACPVDAERLGLHDYYKVIEKPMDFRTIDNRMKAKGYKNVREMCADMRLVFKNAIKYNDERHDVHVIAKILLEKFEEKWLKLLPEVVIEEERWLGPGDACSSNVKM